MHQRRMHSDDEATKLGRRELVGGRERLDQRSQLRNGRLRERWQRIPGNSFERVPRLTRILRGEDQFTQLV